jgi:hypothetical protein
MTTTTRNIFVFQRRANRKTWFSIIRLGSALWSEQDCQRWLSHNSKTVITKFVVEQVQS